jgi:hypothetical protein
LNNLKTKHHLPPGRKRWVGEESRHPQTQRLNLHFSRTQLTEMAKLLRWLSTIFFILALAGIATLLAFDVLNRLKPTPIHQRAGALSFMLIGASYISLQLGTRRRWSETLKGVMLGVAFLLWGGEQFLPPSLWVTAMDSLVVLIFVVDLSLIIVGRLKRNTPEPP